MAAGFGSCICTGCRGGMEEVFEDAGAKRCWIVIFYTLVFLSHIIFGDSRVVLVCPYIAHIYRLSWFGGLSYTTSIGSLITPFYIRYYTASIYQLVGVSQLYIYYFDYLPAFVSTPISPSSSAVSLQLISLYKYQNICFLGNLVVDI